MKFGSIPFRPLALAALVASSGASQAALVVYTAQSAFNAATSAQGVDTYTGFSITGSTPSPITRTAGSYTYRATTSDLSPAGATGFFGAGTSANPWLSTNYALDSITFDGFSPSIAAIGGNFFGSDQLGAFLAGNMLLEAVDTTGTLTQAIIGATTSSFVGFVSTTSLVSLKVTSVQPTSGFLWPTIDNLTLAQRAASTVPEPTTWALVAVGLLAAAGVRRRA